jgi:VWFA-related protein
MPLKAWSYALLLVLAQQQGVIRVNTRLVEVNVVVRDKQGPVRDLKRDDFTVLDNGKKQRIEVFTVTGIKAMNPSPKLPPLPQGVYSNRLESGGARSTAATVILLDLFNTAAGDQPYAISELVRYLKTVRKEDRVSLYIFDGRLRIIQDFTGDPERLIRAMAKIRPGVFAGSETMSAAELAGAFGINGDFANGMAAFYASNQADRTAEALEAIAYHVGGLPGRKNLIWMSAGFPFAPEFLLNSPDTPVRFAEDPLFLTAPINRASRAISDANMSIYGVDVRGLPAPDVTKSVGRPLPPLVRPESMLRLAEATGGKVYFFTNDLKGAVAEAVADADVTYTLGFYAGNEGFDGTVHRLTVSVDRKGLEVRHRSSYVAADTQAIAEPQRRSSLLQLAWNSLDASEIELAAHAETDPAHPENRRVFVSVNAADLRLEQQNNRRVGMIGAAFRLESTSSNQEKTNSIRIDISEEQYRAALKTGFLFDESIPNVPPGSRLRIVVQDQVSGLAGSLWLPFQK